MDKVLDWSFLQLVVFFSFLTGVMAQSIDTDLVGIIIASVCVGLLIIAVIAIAAFCCFRRMESDQNSDLGRKLSVGTASTSVTPRWAPSMMMPSASAMPVYSVPSQPIFYAMPPQPYYLGHYSPRFIDAEQLEYTARSSRHSSRREGQEPRREQTSDVHLQPARLLNGHVQHEFSADSVNYRVIRKQHKHEKMPSWLRKSYDSNEEHISLEEEGSRASSVRSVQQLLATLPPYLPSQAVRAVVPSSPIPVSHDDVSTVPFNYTIVDYLDPDQAQPPPLVTYEYRVTSTASSLGQSVNSNLSWKEKPHPVHAEEPWDEPVSPDAESSGREFWVGGTGSGIETEQRVSAGSSVLNQGSSIGQSVKSNLSWKEKPHPVHAEEPWDEPVSPDAESSGREFRVGGTGSGIETEQRVSAGSSVLNQGSSLTGSLSASLQRNDEQLVLSRDHGEVLIRQAASDDATENRLSGGSFITNRTSSSFSSRGRSTRREEPWDEIEEPKDETPAQQGRPISSASMQRVKIIVSEDQPESEVQLRQPAPENALENRYSARSSTIQTSSSFSSHTRSIRREDAIDEPEHESEVQLRRPNSDLTFVSRMSGGSLLVDRASTSLSSRSASVRREEPWDEVDEGNEDDLLYMRQREPRKGSVPFLPGLHNQEKDVLF